MWYQLSTVIERAINIGRPARLGVDRSRTRHEPIPGGSQPRFPRSTVQERSTPNRASVLRCVFLGAAALMLAACSQIPFGIQEPQVKVTGLELLPVQGMEQRIAVHLGITNPNGRDLSIRGISYNIGIENIDVLSGVTGKVPTLKAYEETPVTVEVSANLLSIARLVQHFSQREVSDRVSYNFDAKLDFSQWLPDMRVQEQGEIKLQY